MSSNPYFKLDGAYSEISLYNSPDPIQDMHYPCLTSYPFLSDFQSYQIDRTPLETDYKSMNETYRYKQCPYCNLSHNS